MPGPRDWQGGQMPRSSPGGGSWAQVELTNALLAAKRVIVICINCIYQFAHGRWTRKYVPFRGASNFLGIGVRAGGGKGGGLQPPQILGNSVFLGNKRKFGQSQFLKTSPWLFDYFEDLNINLKSA